MNDGPAFSNEGRPFLFYQMKLPPLFIRKRGKDKGG